MPKWTNEQLDAINKSGTNIIVSAGAGSGKTAVLSERVLRILKEGTHIDELLILTFTNAAAKEMKERIRKKIKEKPLLIEEIDLQVYHFNIYKKEFKNYEVNYQKMRDLQNKIFYYEEKDIDSKTDFKAIKLFDEIDVDSIGVNCALNMKYIVVNKVVVDLKEQFKEIGKLAYLNKNYNPYPNNKKKCILKCTP